MISLYLRAFTLTAMPFLSLSFSSTSPQPSSKEVYGIQGSGWSSPEWKWGSATGTGHDCAKICRQQYATTEARAELIECLLLSKEDMNVNLDERTPENFEEVKLVLALAWQKARKKCYGGLETYGELLDEMAKGQRYEEGTEEFCSMLLVQHMQKRFFWLYPDVQDKISMNILLYDCDDDFDWIRRRCSGLVLKAMEFEEIGL